MKFRNRFMLTVVALMACIGVSVMNVEARDRLTLYCSPQIDWCQLMVKLFEKETGIKVAMTRKSSGETFAQIKAESRNPKGDTGGAAPGIRTCRRPKRA